MVRAMVLKFTIQDRSVTRLKLEYPTEDVSFTYLAAIEKVRVFRDTRFVANWTILTYDLFTDKAVEIYYVINACDMAFTRHNLGDRYLVLINPALPVQDHRILRHVAGLDTILGSEAVDLTPGLPERNVFSISGSTLKSFRGAPLAPQITATDTAIAAGLFGFATHQDRAVQNLALAWLRPPSSPLPMAQAILEVEVEGDGTPGNPYRPRLQENLTEIRSLQGLPSHLYLESRKYEILRRRRLTDEEMKLLLGYTPQHQVDLNSVTWGAYEFNPSGPTNIIIVTADNPYQQGAIERHVEAARNKNMKALTPPRDYQEAKEQFKQLKAEYQYWLTGKDNYAYMTRGWTELDLLQNIDFYHGELIDHRTHYQQLKQTPDWVMWSRLEVLEDQLNKITVLTEERDKHLGKLREVKRLGW
jgi:hypothetical protein